MIAPFVNGVVKQFGSDVYTHYTAVYTWNSNQMAHAMMGFAGTTLFIHAATRLGLEVWYGAIFYIIPILKDTTDYLADGSIRSHHFKLKTAHRRELILDALTDNFFWAAGVVLALFVVAMSSQNPPWWSCAVVLAAFLLIMAGIFVARRHFNEQKRRFDVSGLPYYFRLPTYAGQLANAPDSDSPEAKQIEEVEKFVYMDESRPSHLMLCGPPGSYKTTLAAAIGSGLTIRRQVVRYLSKARLVEEFATTAERHTDRATTEPVHPHKADILIIDDLDQPDGLEEVLPALAGKSTVWVVSCPKAADLKCWMSDRLNGHLVAIELVTPNRELCNGPPLRVRVWAAITMLVSIISVVGAFGLLMVL